MNSDPAFNPEDYPELVEVYPGEWVETRLESWHQRTHRDMTLATARQTYETYR